MTNKNNTKRALLASVLSIVMCLTMLIGSTFAWFTDTATTGVNTITSGNLDLVVEYLDENGAWTEVDENTKLFKEGLWEPGYTDVAYLKLSNNGSLALKYQLTANVTDEDEGTNVNNVSFKLSDYIQFGQVESNTEIAEYATREAAQNAVAGKTAPLKSYTKEGALNANGDAAYIALVAYMPTTTNNDANHNGDAPSIKFGVNVIATQNTFESDSYNNRYDEDALMPNERLATSNAEFLDLVNSIKNNTANGVDTVRLAAGEYDIFDISQNWGAYEINIIGATNEDGTPATIINMNENVNWGIAGTVKNIKFKDASNSKMLMFKDGNGLHCDIVVDNCVFDGASMQFIGAAEIKNSTFNGNDAAWSGIQYSCPSGDIVIDNCKFSGYRFTNLQVTDEGAHKDLTVTVKDCVIGELASDWNEGYDNEGVTLYVDTIILENNTIDCDVWTPSFANVTKTDNKTSNAEEVSYKNW